MPTDDYPILPLWIAGRACLRIPPACHDVRASDGTMLRRTPLCGEREVREAASAARAALPSWQACPASERAARLVALGEAIGQYADHFAALISAETGGGLEPAAREVAASVDLLLRAPAALAAERTGFSGVVSIAGATDYPLQAPLALALPALLGGATVILCPAPQTPSALLACAELTASCAFPAGVFNIVHGGEEVLCALRGLSASQAQGTSPSIMLSSARYLGAAETPYNPRA